LHDVVLGLVFRIDILGGYAPSTKEDMVHDIYSKLFLMTCQLVSRYKLHKSREFVNKLDTATSRWSQWAQRGCFQSWLRCHSNIQQMERNILEDRRVENKLVAAIFNENWTKKEPLQKAVMNLSPHDVLECVAAFSERVFHGCYAEKMVIYMNVNVILQMYTYTVYMRHPSLAGLVYTCRNGHQSVHVSIHLHL